MTKSSNTRDRKSVKLTDEGLSKLRINIAQDESNGDKEFKGVSDGTFTKIINRTQAVDISSLESVFKEYNLKLQDDDYFDPRRQVPCSWDVAPDTSQFVGRLEELKQLRKLVLDENYRLVTLLGSGGSL